jgi:hypothetical protein
VFHPVENALKHNRYSAGQPLWLCLCADDEDLVIEHSTSVGLESLARRAEHACNRRL